MALTRKYLESLGLTEVQVNGIIEAHTETVNALKGERDTYKADAEKLAGVQKQLDDLTGEDWKGKYESEHKAFDDYKRDAQTRETQGKVKSAYRAMLENDLHIAREDADLIMAAINTGDMKLDGEGKLDGIDALRDSAKTKYARYVPDVKSNGDKPATPPKNDTNNGANPLAAEIAKARYERLYGKAPNGAQNNNNEVK